MISLFHYLRIGLLAALMATSTAYAQEFATRFLVTEVDGAPVGDTIPLISGVPVTLKVTALNDSGVVITDYARPVTVTLADPYTNDFLHVRVTIPRSEFLANADGTAEFTITPLHAGTDNRRIAVTDGNIATYNANVDGAPFSVAPARFYAAYQGSYVGLGTFFNSAVVTGPNVTRIIALNEDGSVAYGYTGGVMIESDNMPFEAIAFFSANGVAENVILNFAAANEATEITISDGITTSVGANTPANGSTFVVRARQATGGLAAATGVIVEGSLRPGSTISVQYDIKATGDAPVTSDDPLGTLTSIRIFNTTFGFTVYGNGPAESPESAAQNGARTVVTFVLPEDMPVGSYTMRINSGLSAPNADSARVIGGLPDLIIRRFDYAPGEYQAGDAVRFDMVWENQVFSPGSNERNASLPITGGFVYRNEIHLSTNDTFGDEDDVLVWVDSFVGDTIAGRLLAGQFVSISGEFKLPENLPGTYFLFAKVNSSGGREGEFSTGFEEQIGPTPPDVLQDGNNMTLPRETQKLTILPRTASETARVSLTADNDQLVGNSDQAIVTRDGAYVVMQSLAPLAGVGSSNGFNQIFRKNPVSGQVDLVTVGTSGVAANGHSTRPKVSDDGRYIVFESTATNLDPSDTNGFTDVYLRDMQLGITRRLSMQGITQANSGSFRPSISANGRFVTFESTARNLVAGATSGVSQIYLYDRSVNGSSVFDTAGNTSLTLVSVNAGVSGTLSSTNARISADANYVVFTTRSPNLLGGVNAQFAQTVRWTRLGGTLLTVSARGGVIADGVTDFPVINADGSKIAFVSRSLNLTDDVADVGVPHIFRTTVTNGAVTEIIRVNGAGNVEPNNPLGGLIGIPDLGSFEPSISADGNLIAFASESNNLLAPVPVRHIDRTVYLSSEVFNVADSNNVVDVYLADLTDPANPQVQRASVSTFGFEATLRTVGTTVTVRIPSSRAPSISPDGRYIVFTSDAEGHNGLVFGDTNFDYVDTNGSRDIYLLDRKTDLSESNNLPTSALRMPAALTVTAGTPVELIADATTTRAITSVEFYANNLLVGTTDTPAIANTGRYVFTWTAPHPGNGNFAELTYEIVAVSVDNAGSRSLVSNLSRVTVLPAVSGAIPVIAINSPLAGASLTTNSSVQLTASASDADGNLVGVQFYVNGVAVGPELVRAPSQTAATFTFATAWSPSLGVSTIVAVARDQVGNRIMSAPTTVNVILGTGTPPVVTLTSPTTSVVFLGTAINLRANASDDGVVTGVTFYQNGQVITTVANAPYAAAFTPTELGVYQIYATARDNFGNESSTSPVAVTVVPVPLPTISLAVPAPSTITLGQTSVLTATAQTGAGSIVSVDFFANGTLLFTDFVSPYTVIFEPTAAINYEIVAVATDSFGGTVVSDVRILSVQPRGIIDDIYISILGRLPTGAEVTASIGRTPGQIAADLILTDTYRDGDSELILSHLAVFGVYPSRTQLAVLRELREQEPPITDVDLVGILLRSLAYSQVYGSIDDLSITTSTQFSRIQEFGNRINSNVSHLLTPGTILPLIPQYFFNQISTVLPNLGLTPEQALVSYINTFYSGGKLGVGLEKLRIAGLIILLSDEVPTVARINELMAYPLADVATYYLNGGTGSFVGTVGLLNWRQAQFGSSANSGAGADAADFDNDGIPNLLEYAFGTNPTAASANPVAMGVTANGQFLTLTFNRILNPALTYRIEASNNLATGFTPTGVSFTGSAAGTVTYTDTVNIKTATAPRFLRVVVSY